MTSSHQRTMCWREKKTSKNWYAVLEVCNCTESSYVAQLFIPWLRPVQAVSKPVEPELQKTSSAQVFLDKLDLFRWSGAVRIYIVFDEFIPVPTNWALIIYWSQLQEQKPALQKPSQAFLHWLHTAVTYKSSMEFIISKTLEPVFRRIISNWCIVKKLKPI